MKRDTRLDQDLEGYDATADAVLRMRRPESAGGKWALYTAAAGSALTLAPDAEAAIIYSGLQNITVSNGITYLDLDGNAASDFFASAFTFGAATGSARLARLGLNAVVYGPGAVRRLSSGATIGTAESFRGGGFLRNVYSGALLQGTWPGGSPTATTGFAGVQFDRGGDTHFGWIRIQLQTGANGQPTEMTIVDWAWEDTAGTAITTGQVPEPSSVVLLGMGAAGLAALRRRRAR